MQNINLSEIVALAMSFLSLVIAVFALFYSILKHGKVKFIIYSNDNDANVSINATYSNIPDLFFITIPVIVKNSGVNAKTINGISWSFKTASAFKARVFDEPKFSDINGWLILNPYEQKMGVIQMEFMPIGYGEGYSNIYKTNVEKAAKSALKDDFSIELKYKFYGKKRIKDNDTSFCIKNLVQKAYKK